MRAASLESITNVRDVNMCTVLTDNNNCLGDDLNVGNAASLHVCYFNDTVYIYVKSFMFFFSEMYLNNLC